MPTLNASTAITSTTLDLCLLAYFPRNYSRWV